MADVEGAVREAVVEVLALDDDEVTPQSTLMDDLGAESIDLLDILFRIEKSIDVQIEGKLHADEVMSLSTVQNLVDMVKGRAEGARAPGDPPRVPRRLRVGVDVVGVARLERVVGGDERRQASLFTPGELAYCHGKRRCYEHMAARFAAKEAVLKAFGTGISQRMRWTDVEVVHGLAGRPHVALDGEVAEEAGRRGIAQIDVSLSHTREYAVAQAVAVSSGAAG